MTTALLAPPADDPPVATPPRLTVRPVVESRPPSASWRSRLPPRPPGPPPQPELDLATTELTGPPRVEGVRSAVVAGGGAVPDPALPDAAAWSRSLAQGLVEVLWGRRGPGQLSRWVDERVLADVMLHRRRHAATRPGSPVTVGSPDPGGAPVRLRSVRVQHPTPEVAEVAAHLRSGGRAAAMAFRLEARHGRWLCTALQLGPRGTG